MLLYGLWLLGKKELIMTEEFDKELAKEIKKLQIEAVTAEAVIKHIISECKIDIEYYQEGNQTVLVIPIDDIGIEIEFSNTEVVQKKETLQQLLSLVDKKLSLSEWINYCNVNHLKLLSNTARKHAVILDGIKEIKGWFFSSRVLELVANVDLVSVKIPDSVTTIGDEVFAYCSSLKKIIYDGTKVQWKKLKVNESQFRNCKEKLTVKCSDGDIQIPLLFIENSMIKSCNKYAASVEIPAGVTTIGAGAFSGCSSLQQINIPAGVTTIEEHTFSRCSSLKEINIPAGVTTIGDGTFYACESLQQINIPAGVTTIGEGAFSECLSLQQINIPAGVTTIGERAFEDCSSLKEIIYDGTMSQWENIEKGKNWNEGASSFTVHCTDGDIKVKR